MNLISTRLELNNYLDISLINNFDDTENPKFVCDATFKIGTSLSGLYFDIYEIKNMHVSYTGVTYTDDEEENENIELDLNEYEKQIVIDKSNEDNKSLILSEVEIDQNKSIVILYFTY